MPYIPSESFWRNANITWRIYLLRYMIVFSATFIPTTATYLQVEGDYEPDQILIINLVLGCIILIHHLLIVLKLRWFYGIMTLALTLIEMAGLLYINCSAWGWSYASSLQLLVMTNAVVLLVGLFIFLALFVADGWKSRGRLLIQPYDPFRYCHIPAGRKPDARTVAMGWTVAIWKPAFEGEFWITRFIRGIITLGLLASALIYSFGAVIRGPAQQSGMIPTRQYSVNTQDFANVESDMDFPVWSVIAYAPLFQNALRKAVQVTPLWAPEAVDMYGPGPLCSALPDEPENSQFGGITIYCPVGGELNDPYVVKEAIIENIAFYDKEIFPDLLVTVNFTTLGQAQPVPLANARASAVSILLGLTNNTADAFASTVPVPLFRGQSLLGVVRRSFRNKLVDPSSATLGIFTSLKTFLVADVGPILPDPSPLINRSSDIGTLRLFIQNDVRDWAVKEDFMDNTLIDGLAQVGGFWSLLDSVTAILFGGSLLFIAFGGKQLAAFGGISTILQEETLIRAIEKQYPALAEESAAPESQRGLLAFLRDNIIDMDPIKDSEGGSLETPAKLPDNTVDLESAHLMEKDTEARAGLNTAPQAGTMELASLAH